MEDVEKREKMQCVVQARVEERWSESIGLLTS